MALAPRPARVSTDPSHDSLTLRTSWLVAGKTLAFGFTVAIPMLLVRRMPQHEFGLYKQIFLVINSAVTMLPLGFGMTAFYFLPREPERRRHTVLNIVLMASATATVFAAVLILFPGTLGWLFSQPDALPFAPWIGAVVALWAVGSSLETIIVANQEVKLAAGTILLIQITRALLFVVAAAASGTIRAVLIAALALGAAQVAVLVLYLSSRFPRFWCAFDWQFLRRQLEYALPFGAAGLLYSMERDLHNYFVSNRFGADAYAVYSIGCFQLPLFGILAESVGSVMIPRCSALQHDGETREILLLTARAARKLAGIYFPAFAFLFVMRRTFIAALFTDRYLPSVPIFAWNLMLIPLGILVFDPVFRAFAAHRHFPMKVHAVVLACLIVGLPVVLSRFGLTGAIALVVVLTAATLLIGLAKVGRMLHGRVSDLLLLRDVVKIGAAAGMAALATTVIEPALAGMKPMVMLGALAAWYGLVYAAAVVLFRIPALEERALVANYVRRFTVAVGTPPRRSRARAYPASSQIASSRSNTSEVSHLPLHAALTSTGSDRSADPTM